MNTIIWHKGMRVMLRANKKEGWPAQRAIIVGVQRRGILTVRVDPEDAMDDGLREITPDQIARERR